MATDTKGSSKYAHYSELDPDFAPLKAECDKQFDQLWSLPFDQFCQGWLDAPPALPADAPFNLDITHQMVPVRDGSKVEIRLYKPPTWKKDGKHLLHYVAHGGGWVVGNHNVEEGLNRMVCQKNNAVVVSVDYRMAPKFKFPYAVNDCFDVLKWCQENASELGINPETIVTGGGSAGGNLSAVTAMKARDEGLTGIIGQLLNIPVTCHPKHFPSDKYEYTSYKQNADASIIDAPKMLWFWDQYLPNAEPEVYASPLLAKSLKGLPPALVQIAGLDPLRDEGIAYADALKEAGVAVELKIYKGLPHGFYMFPQLKASAEYWQNVVAWIKELEAGRIQSHI
ncbi:MAG: hypothetical protein M1827_005208 [Pycnora praestabilis]|nr:MAG: hypothetical protein M1827_005208 [Pycnora praestabilis]